MRSLIVMFSLALLAACSNPQPTATGWDQAAESLPDPKHPPSITVYHSPSCGCCKDWIAHLKTHNFTVIDKPMDDVTPIKREHGLPPALESCHTALVDGYVIEGHVPADDIKRLLKTKPAIAGLSVPEMPHGTPGMETGRKDPFQVISFDQQGSTAVFNAYQNY